MPESGNALHRQKLAEERRDPRFWVALVLSGPAVLVPLLAIGQTDAAIVGGIAAPIGVWLMISDRVGERAEEEVLRQVADERGFTYRQGDFEPPAHTPLLQAGARRRMARAIEREGTLLGHYTWSAYRSINRFTVAIAPGELASQSLGTQWAAEHRLGVESGGGHVVLIAREHVADADRLREMLDGLERIVSAPAPASPAPPA